MEDDVETKKDMLFGLLEELRNLLDDVEEEIENTMVFIDEEDELDDIEASLHAALGALR